MKSYNGRKRPMGEQAVPEWGLDPWIWIVDADPVFEEVVRREEENEKARREPGLVERVKMED